VGLADAGGGLATTYTYAPFGETSVSGLPSFSPFQFTGRENDGTGLYYYRARYYDPVRSRFVSPDPIGFGGGINFYRYVRNNPQGRRDPRGLQEQWPGDPLPGLVDPADEWRELMNAIVRLYSRMGRKICEQLCEKTIDKVCPRLEGPASSTLCDVLCGEMYDSLERYAEDLERQRRHNRFLEEHGQ
jgi:RHS repeat-associated protein